MDYIKDAITVNSKAFRKTLESYKYFPIIIVILLFVMIVNLVANSLLTLASAAIPVPYIWGIVSYVVDVATLSLLMVGLSKVMNRSNLTLDNFTNDWQRFMGPLMNTRFVFWLIELVIFFIQGSPLATIPFLGMAVLIIYQILSSPMLETIYIGGEQGQEALFSIIEFLKNNFLQWIPVTIAFSYLMMRISSYSNMNLLFNFNFNSLLKVAGAYILMSFVYIYKGHLYSILHNSSVRKRKFMGDSFYDYN